MAISFKHLKTNAKNVDISKVLRGHQRNIHRKVIQSGKKFSKISGYLNVQESKNLKVLSNAKRLKIFKDQSLNKTA